jgi:hypothetical protein
LFHEAAVEFVESVKLPPNSPDILHVRWITVPGTSVNSNEEKLERNIPVPGVTATKK